MSWNSLCLLFFISSKKWFLLKMNTFRSSAVLLRNWQNVHLRWHIWRCHGILQCCSLLWRVFVLLPSHFSIVVHCEPTFPSTHSLHKPLLPYYFNQRDFDIISSHLALRTWSVLLILTEINVLFSCWIPPAASVVIPIISQSVEKALLSLFLHFSQFTDMPNMSGRGLEYCDVPRANYLLGLP